MTAEGTIVSGIAGRYATALFELAAERHKLDEVAEDLRSLADLIDDNADLRRLVRSPMIKSDDQARDNNRTAKDTVLAIEPEGEHRHDDDGREQERLWEKGEDLSEFEIEINPAEVKANIKCGDEQNYLRKNEIERERRRIYA